MRQILQHLGTGETLLVEVPAPGVSSGRVVVATEASLISLGTERMLVEFGRASWLEKARQQPEKVRQVLAKVRSEGLFPTLEAVRAKLDQPLPLGYCQTGRVLAVGSGVEGFAVGDRVATNGPHAEVVSVPQRLCAKVPEGVEPAAAAFTVAGAIALQGVRLLRPTLGERVAVFGLGLLGQLAVQILRAQGCGVLGIDPDPARVALAERWGAQGHLLRPGDDPAAAARLWTGGLGVDGALITAATASSEPVRQAARACRQRGRIVLVGVTGLELNRADFYEKELTFQVSCSYGPGRYDRNYEEKGQDYPPGFVRWTEQRNFEAVLQLLAERKLDVLPLISARFPIARATEAYQAVLAGGALGLILEYDPPAVSPTRIVTLPAPADPLAPRTAGKAAGPVSPIPILGWIGAGNFTTRTLLPALGGQAVRRKLMVSAGGATAAWTGRKFGFESAGTDLEMLWSDPEIEAVVIATRHDSHAQLASRGLRAGRHIFVEKPLALTESQVTEVESAWREAPPTAAGHRPVLMVGFNRRFAPLVVRLRQLLEAVPGPKTFLYTVNAGSLTAGHWAADPESGGGRLVGEACHFLDLLRHLAGSPVEESRVDRLGGTARDNASLSLRFADGSLGSIHYLTEGHAAFPKERLEVFAGGRILQLDNYRVLRGWGWPGFSRAALWRPAKGHREEMAAFLAALRGEAPPPIPPEELFEVARVTLALHVSATYHRPSTSASS